MYGYDDCMGILPLQIRRAGHKKDHKHHHLGMHREKGEIQPCRLSARHDCDFAGVECIAGVIKWRGLRSRKTSASGRVSCLQWYISPNREAVRRYCHTESHSSECSCSLVIRSISLALSLAIHADLT